MITSYGIIVYTILDGKKYFLIGKRPDSLEFLDMFNVRCPIEKVEMYVKMCTDYERWKLWTYRNDFEKIYLDSFCPHRNYDEIKKRWDKIKHIVIKSLKEGGPYKKSRSMYILPKGRKKQGEIPEQAALREFEEETRIPINKIEKADNNVHLDHFVGSDDKSYKTVYFVYKADKAWMPQKIKTISPIKGREFRISFEVETLLWITAEQADDYFDSGLSKIIKTLGSQ